MKDQKREQGNDPSAQPVSPTGWHENEIDLVELIEILWQQRWLMSGVVTFITALAVFYCLTATPSYLISTQITPGVIGYNSEDNMPIRKWGVGDIKSLFEGATHQEYLLEFVPDGASLPEITTSTAKDSNILTINLFWPDPEEGKKILQNISQSIVSSINKQTSYQISTSRREVEESIQKIDLEKKQIEVDRARIKDSQLLIQQEFLIQKSDIEEELLEVTKLLELTATKKKQFDKNISIINNNLKLIDAEQKNIKNDRSEISQAIQNINLQIEAIDRETKEFIKSNKPISSETPDEFSRLMHSSIAQQNIAYLSTLQQRISDLKRELNQYDVMEAANIDKSKNLQFEISEIEFDRDHGLALEKGKLNQKILSYKAELEKLKKETEITLFDVKVNKEQELKSKEVSLDKKIQSLTQSLEAIDAIEIVQAPFSSPKPAQPKKVKIVTVAFLLGLFISVVIGLVSGFLAKKRTNMAQSNKTTSTYS